jgi:uncharacterized protein YcbK (DUF882 family)
MASKKTIMVNIILVSVFLQSCGSLIVPAIQSAHSLRLKHREARLKKAVDESTAGWEEALSPAVTTAETGQVRPDIVPAAARAPQQAQEVPITYAEVEFKPAEVAEGSGETTIEVTPDEEIAVSAFEADVVEANTKDGLEGVSAAIEPPAHRLLEEPADPKENIVKSDSFEDGIVKKLVKKASSKNPKKLTVVHPPGQIDDLVVLWNPNTGEALVLDALVDGKTPYEPALEAMKDFMRDRKTGQAVDIDPELVRLLYEMAMGFDSVLYVTSGYRVPGGSTKPTSYHTKGMAADIKHPAASAVELRDFAVAWGAGGVGFYPKSNSIHVDTREKPYYWIVLSEGKAKEIPDMKGIWADKFK